MWFLMIGLLPGFHSDEWAHMFGTATFIFPFDKEHDEMLEACEKPDNAQ
jgi:hypothetical protein